MSSRPTVALCSGKDCRKRCEYSPLRRELQEVAKVLPVKCLDICDSPVVVISPRAKDAVVLDKIRTESQRRDLVKAIDGSHLSKALAKQIVTGRRRAKVLAKLS
jgi:predicted metal-binding protein